MPSPTIKPCPDCRAMLRFSEKDATRDMRLLPLAETTVEPDGKMHKVIREARSAIGEDSANG